MTRELELKNLLSEEDIDIMFLTEVDTIAITGLAKKFAKELPI